MVDNKFKKFFQEKQEKEKDRLSKLNDKISQNMDDNLKELKKISISKKEENTQKSKEYMNNSLKDISEMLGVPSYDFIEKEIEKDIKKSSNDKEKEDKNKAEDKNDNNDLNLTDELEKKLNLGRF